MSKRVFALLLALAFVMWQPAWARDGRSSSTVPNETGFFFDTSISPGGDYHDAEAVDFGDCSFIVCIENASATLSVLVDLVPCGTSVAASDLVTPTSDSGMSTVQIVLPVSSSAPVPCFSGWYSGLIWQGQTSAASARGRILR